jgi:hypothetical protein
MKSTLIVLLGCNILSILYDRVNTAINFVNKSNSEKSFSLFNFSKQKDKKSFHWLLTGGFKGDFSMRDKPEAEIMLEHLEKQNFQNSHFIIDTNSTNTVENFIFLTRYLNESFYDHQYEDIYIVTSSFHYERAKLISDKINPTNNYKWLLGSEDTKDLVFWEKYHKNNVDRDIQRAIILNNYTVPSINKDEL